jgi:hypothetical protein
VVIGEGRPLNYMDLKGKQPDRKIIVFVAILHVQRVYLDCNAEFLEKFPDEAVLGSFSLLGLSSGEFPLAFPRRAFFPPRDEDLSALLGDAAADEDLPRFQAPIPLPGLRAWIGTPFLRRAPR